MNKRGIVIALILGVFLASFLSLNSVTGQILCTPTQQLISEGIPPSVITAGTESEVASLKLKGYSCVGEPTPAPSEEEEEVILKFTLEIEKTRFESSAFSCKKSGCSPNIDVILDLPRTAMKDCKLQIRSLQIPNPDKLNSAKITSCSLEGQCADLIFCSTSKLTEEKKADLEVEYKDRAPPPLPSEKELLASAKQGSGETSFAILEKNSPGKKNDWFSLLILAIITLSFISLILIKKNKSLKVNRKFSDNSHSFLHVLNSNNYSRSFGGSKK